MTSNVMDTRASLTIPGHIGVGRTTVRVGDEAAFPLHMRDRVGQLKSGRAAISHDGHSCRKDVSSFGVSPTRKNIPLPFLGGSAKSSTVLLCNVLYSTVQ